ncbi:cold-shock protein [Pelagibaculum spongiae]|uniref:Cold-shock protein n=2 Tax=Pelagibaculum spongiae TaxID=2080658 RepID=A0A2V1GSC2_9GAMM|nr:cold-shock protein [Pelagibaculum spongiae]
MCRIDSRPAHIFVLSIIHCVSMNLKLKFLSSFLAGGLVGGVIVASLALDPQSLIYLAVAVAVVVALLLIVPALSSDNTSSVSSSSSSSPSSSSTSSSYTPAASGVSMGQRETGTVKWFNGQKGFGFISRDTGDEVFVHFRAIRGRGNRYLVQGQRVEFTVATEDKGLRAEDVVVVSG